MQWSSTVQYNKPQYRDRILGRNPDKSLQSFPPCYSQSHLQLCLRFLFLQIHANSYSFCKEERRKTWWKIIPPSLWFKKSIQKPHVWELSRLCPETSTWLYVHEFGFSTVSPSTASTVLQVPSDEACKFLCCDSLGLLDGEGIHMYSSSWVSLQFYSILSAYTCSATRTKSAAPVRLCPHTNKQLLRSTASSV